MTARILIGKLAAILATERFQHVDEHLEPGTPRDTWTGNFDTRDLHVTVSIRVTRRRDRAEPVHETVEEHTDELLEALR